jgi:hypothetical protein
MIDRINKNWDNHITDEEIFNREFSIGYLIQSNQHLDVFQNLKDVVLSTYDVTARFEYMGYNGNAIYANGQKLVCRKSKTGGLHISKNTQIIEHNLSLSGGGSNAYPSVSFEGAYAVIKFRSYGLPFVDKLNGWSIRIVELNKFNPQ